MPNFDKTGPAGKGPMTGRSQGDCSEKDLKQDKKKKISSIKLNDTTFNEIESIIQKVAKENDISGVTSVIIKLSKNQSLISFDKVAVPQDLQEEFGPFTRAPETEESILSRSREKFVFPGTQLFDILQDLKEYIENHEESQMIPQKFLEEIKSIRLSLREVWSALEAYAQGEDWMVRPE